MPKRDLNHLSDHHHGAGRSQGSEEAEERRAFKAGGFALVAPSGCVPPEHPEDECQCDLESCEHGVPGLSSSNGQDNGAHCV